MGLTVEIIRDIEKQEPRLREAWVSFDMHAIPNGFFFNDILRWWKQYKQINNSRIGYNKQCIILLIYKENKLKAILPLMKADRFKYRYLKITTLEFLSQSFTGGNLDIIQNSLTPGDIKEIFLFLDKTIKYDFINLSYLDIESVLMRNSPGDIFLHAGKVIIPLDADYENIKKETYSKNLRHILNKFNRRIRESDNPILSAVIEGKENIMKIKEAVKGVSLSKLISGGMHSVYENEEWGARYFEDIVSKTHPFCSAYFDNEKLISYNIGYIENGIVYAVDAAYNRAYAEAGKIGLGILAYDKLVEKYSGKYRFLDMGFGLDDYKFRFSKQVKYTYTLMVKGNTFKSELVYKRILAKNRELEINLRSRAEKYSDDKNN